MKIPLKFLLLLIAGGIMLTFLSGAGSGKTAFPDVVEASRQCLLKALGDRADEVSLSLFYAPSGLPARGKILEAKAPLPLRREGFINVLLKVLENDKMVRNVYVGWRITPLREVWVTSKTIERGDDLSPENVEQKKIAVDFPASSILSEKKDIEQKKAAYSLPTGTVLLRSMLLSAPLIKAGEPVVIELMNGGVSVTATGQALEDGCLGRYMKVRTEAFKKDLQVQVIDSGRVKAFVR